MPDMNSDLNTMLPPPNRPQQQQSAAAAAAAASEEVPDRHMNDTTMPPPQQRFSQQKKEQQEQRNTTVIRKKRVPAVNPKGRFGLHDWKRLLQAAPDLAQRKGAPLRRDIPWDEIKLHNRNHDGWIVLRQKVYNVGPYLPYHPGGVAIFKNILGKDATSLFDKYHRWVNIDGLIGPLLLGSVEMTATPAANPFSVVPPKESHLTNAPRVSTQKRTSLLAGQEDDDDEEEDQILPP